MKPIKLEFVVFKISQENAVFLWNGIVKVLQFLGFDVTGNVTEVTYLDYDANVMTEEEYKYLLSSIDHMSRLENDKGE